MKEKSQQTSHKYKSMRLLQQLYGNKQDNLEETDKLLEMYTLLRLNHEQKINMNRLITSKEI